MAIATAAAGAPPEALPGAHPGEVLHGAPPMDEECNCDLCSESFLDREMTKD